MLAAYHVYLQGRPTWWSDIYKKKYGGTHPKKKKKGGAPEFKYRALKNLSLTCSLNLLKHIAQDTKIQFLY